MNDELTKDYRMFLSVQKCMDAQPVVWNSIPRIVTY